VGGSAGQPVSPIKARVVKQNRVKKGIMGIPHQAANDTKDGQSGKGVT